MNRKQRLMNDIMMYDFALQDASLYLDVQKDDMEAKRYYQRNKQLLQRSKQEYEREFGLLSTRSSGNNDYASYVQEKWPWEKMSDVENNHDEEEC